MVFENSERLSLFGFLSQCRPAIKAEFLKHKAHQGFILVRADESFQKVEELRFIQMGFDKDKFQSISEFAPGEEPGQDDTNWLFYEIQRGQQGPAWCFKEYNR